MGNKRKYEHRKERRAAGVIMDELASFNGTIQEEHQQAERYKRSWEAEKILSKMYQDLATRQRQKTITFALMFWSVFVLWIGTVVYFVGR